MITADQSVEKYRDLFDPQTIAAALRLRGLSEVEIRNSVGSDADHESNVQRFRRQLLKEKRPDQINRYLSLFESHTRALPMLEAVVDEPSTTVFWQVIVRNWDICDGFWRLRTPLIYAFLERAAELSPIEFLDPKEQTFYNSLPDSIAVYRGCSRRKVRGLSWTTEFKVAEFFGRGGRLSAPNDPVVATAEIAKSDVFFVSTQRQEHEIVLYPYALKRLKLHTIKLP